MNDNFYTILKMIFWHRCSVLLVLFILGTVINAVYLFRLKTQFQKNHSGRRRHRIQDYEKRKRNCISQYILGLAGIVLLFFTWALPPLQDAIAGLVIESHAVYYRVDAEEHTAIPNVGEDVRLTVDQNSFSVELYPGFSEKTFPTGTYQAVVWYTPNSKILLDVILLQQIDYST